MSKYSTLQNNCFPSLARTLSRQCLRTAERRLRGKFHFHSPQGAFYDPTGADAAALGMPNCAQRLVRSSVLPSAACDYELPSVFRLAPSRCYSSVRTIWRLPFC
uniref:Uncharacterized protein n=1 Tax=Trichuris muris TaxID=70415 RepID=A0A5S6QHW5_TRIMR